MSFDQLYNLLDRFVPESIDWIVFTVTALILSLAVINAMVLCTALYTWFERRMLGRFQSRIGPNRWGPFGLLQPIADVIKLLVKEDVIPVVADKAVFTLAPVVLLVPALVVFIVIPFGEQSFLGKLNVGVLFILGVTGVNTLAIIMGGWASRNKYALFGAMRGAAMLISYEVPMALSLIGVIILAGSISLADIVSSQGIFYILVQPLAFLVFMAAASAEMSRAPFDMIESESELGAGYHTEYSGIKYAIFQLAEFMAPLVTAAVATVVFLGGTKGFDPIPGQVWFLLKAFLVVFVLLWVRATWPRLRVDQIMGFAWKGLFPLSVINFFVVAVEMFALQEPDGTVTNQSMMIMVGINWVVMVVSIVVIATVLGQGKLQHKSPPQPSSLANMAASEGD
jgi:NADH-quinone oxidoreductase subunit H|tara:strand:+ start:1753 stop:2940 length:1188 start_codon:yes stop_codon:yes gene_type:complete